MKTATKQQLRFFADENFPPRLAQIMRIFTEGRSTILTMAEEFGMGTPDEEWIVGVGKMSPKPIIIGGDARILTSTARLAALRVANTHFVVFADGFVNLDWTQQVLKTIEVWDRLCNQIKKLHEPYVIKIKIKSGKVIPVKRLMDFQSHSDLSPKKSNRSNKSA